VTPTFFAGAGSLLRSGAGDADRTVDAVAVARTALRKSDLIFISGLLGVMLSRQRESQWRWDHKTF
jgi:hypothetical protein